MLLGRVMGMNRNVASLATLLACLIVQCSNSFVAHPASLVRHERRLSIKTWAGDADDDAEEKDPEEAERIRLFREKMMGRFGGESPAAAAAAAATAAPSEEGQATSLAEGGDDDTGGAEGAKTPRQLRKEAREARRQAAGGAGGAGKTPFVLKQFASEEELAAIAEAEEEAGGSGQPKPWGAVVEARQVGPGTILLGNPAVFCDPKCPRDVLKRCGLAQHIPAEEMDPDRCADVLPAILIVEGDALGAGTVGGECVGLFLNRRTGYLLGDLEQNTAGFLIQPLNLGGTAGSSDLSFLHPYPEVRDSLRVTEDELFYGGSFADAQLLVKKGTGSQFSFRFFVQQTVWKKGALEKELNDGVWLPAACGKDTILKIREREGGRRPKPLWTDVMELVGDDYAQIATDLYDRR